MEVKVKFCGMTNREDVRNAIECGVDFVGFVFCEKSKRYVDYDTVRRITGEFRQSGVGFVGVFVEQGDDEIKKAMEFCRLDYAQVYRDVEGIKTIRVYRIKDMLPESVADGFVLFDSFTKMIGGSGVSFDVNLIEGIDYRDRLFIAGGVNESNVKRIASFGVYGVDLVSSIEAYPGKKDKEKMEGFMKIVRALK